MIRAAGVILRAPSGRVLMLERSSEGDHGGEWAFPGGKIDGDETTSAAVLRELREETGIVLSDPGAVLCTRLSNDVHYTTFLKPVDDELPVVLNDEHSKFVWVKPDEAVGGSTS